MKEWKYLSHVTTDGVVSLNVAPFNSRIFFNLKKKKKGFKYNRFFWVHLMFWPDYLTSLRPSCPSVKTTTSDIPHCTSCSRCHGGYAVKLHASLEDLGHGTEENIHSVKVNLILPKQVYLLY